MIEMRVMFRSGYKIVFNVHPETLSTATPAKGLGITVLAGGDTM